MIWHHDIVIHVRDIVQGGQCERAEREGHFILKCESDKQGVQSTVIACDSRAKPGGQLCWASLLENCLPSRSYLAPTNPPPCPGLLGPRRSLGIPWMRRIQEWEDRRRRVFCVDAVPSSSWESGRTDIRCIAPFAIYLFWPVLVITFLGPPFWPKAISRTVAPKSRVPKSRAAYPNRAQIAARASGHGSGQN